MPDYEKMTDTELDIAVAQKVMGWKLYQYNDDRYARTPSDYDDAMRNDGWWWKGRGGDREAYDWAPSSDISAAWSVVNKMQADGWHYRIEAMQGNRTLCVFGNDLRQVVADSPERAICECALRAIDAQAGAS